MVTIVRMTRAYIRMARKKPFTHSDHAWCTDTWPHQCGKFKRNPSPHTSQWHRDSSSGPSTKYRPWIDLPKGSRFTTEHAKWWRLSVPEHCSESWGMGAEGFRRAPMMHEKTDHACHYEIYHRTEQTYKRLKNCKLVIVSSANYYIGAATTSRIIREKGY